MAIQQKNGEKLRPMMRIKCSADSGFKLAREPFHHSVHGGMVACGMDVLNSEKSRKLTKQTRFKLASTISGNSGKYSEARYSPGNEGSSNRFRGKFHKWNDLRLSGELVYAGYK